MVVVLTQDCDLAQDAAVRRAADTRADEDKLLMSALVCPLYFAEHLREGNHLEQLDRRMQRLNRDRWKPVMNNEVPRYHYLRFPEDSPLNDAVADFKHYFSVNVEDISSNRLVSFRYRIDDLFREDLSHRFSAYLSRIALPEEDPVPALLLASGAKSDVY